MAVRERSGLAEGGHGSQRAVMAVRERSKLSEVGVALLKIDGSYGEGGGQILRSSISLAIITGTPITIEKIRAGRKEPGLRPQHLTSVRAAQQISGAEVEGAAIASSRLTFRPGKVAPGKYHFNVGTAGSTALILQTILPPLMMADSDSVVTLEGGTHNPMAPTIDFLKHTFLPLLARIGPNVNLELIKYGFYPRGGGKIVARINPGKRLHHLEISHAMIMKEVRGRAVVVNLPRQIAERELDEMVRVIPTLRRDESSLAVSKNSIGQGNFVSIEVESDQLTETITGLGKRGIPAEKVARDAAEDAKTYIASGAPVYNHLADQLILPMALAGGGSFVTVEPSLHTRTNIETVKKFLPVDINVSAIQGNLYSIEMRKRKA